MLPRCKSIVSQAHLNVNQKIKRKWGDHFYYITPQEHSIPCNRFILIALVMSCSLAFTVKWPHLYQLSQQPLQGNTLDEFLLKTVTDYFGLLMIALRCRLVQWMVSLVMCFLSGCSHQWAARADLMHFNKLHLSSNIELSEIYWQCSQRRWLCLWSSNFK